MAKGIKPISKEQALSRPLSSRALTEAELRDHVSIYEADERSSLPIQAQSEALDEGAPLDDDQLGRAIAAGSKLAHEEEDEEIYPPGLRLGGSAWVPRTYWGADYRLRLAKEVAEKLLNQAPLRDREDKQGEKRSDLMLDTVLLALDDPAEKP